MYFKKEGFKIKISDIVDELKKSKAPVIRENTPIDQVLDEIINQDSNWVLYVVDDNNRFKGTITLDEIAGHVFAMNHEHRIHPRRIMDMVTSEDVDHIMKKQPPYVIESDDIGEVIKKMVKSNMKHLALVDEDKKIICDISMVDIIKCLIAADKKE